MLIDTHAHVNFAAFKEDAEPTIKRALADGVQVVLVGTQIDTSKEAVELAEKFNSGVYAVAGLHPVHTYSQELDEEESHFRTREENFNTLEYQRICQSTKVVGIGECGLDYFRLPQDDGLLVKQEDRHQAIKQKQNHYFREYLSCVIPDSDPGSRK